MKSLLDNGHTWFFSSAILRRNFEIVLIEGTPSDKLESLTIGEVEIGTVSPIEIKEPYRKARIIFDHVLTYQITDESYTSSDPIGVRIDGDTGSIAVYVKSRFLNHATANKLIPLIVDAPFKHYQIWSLDYVIDVLSTVDPQTVIITE